MRLHTLIPVLLTLTACDAVPKFGPNDGNIVIAKAPDNLRYKHEKHVLAITVGSLIARRETTDEMVYVAPYAVSTEEPFAFEDDMVLTCSVYDEDGTLVGGSGLTIDRAPTGGIVEFKLSHLISDGHIACSAANGKGFTRSVFP